MISKQKQRLKYVSGDFFSVAIGWLVFTVARFFFSRYQIELMGIYSLQTFLGMPNVIISQILVPMVAVGIFWLSGYYNEPFRKSRMEELLTTVVSVFACALVSYFAVALNDASEERWHNYEMFLMMWGILFVAVYTVRSVITAIATRKIRRREWNFPTLIIGNSDDAHAFASRVTGSLNPSGNSIVGFVDILGEKESIVKPNLPVYPFSEVQNAVDENGVDELIIVPEKDSTFENTLLLLNQLYPLNKTIRMSPGLGHILLSNAKITCIAGEMMVDITGYSGGESMHNIKRAIDIVASTMGIVLLLPIYAVIAIAIKNDSRGTVFYKQERIGLNNTPFTIYKFRTMDMDSEKDGLPRLSTTDDNRITRVGHMLRKYRLDELPQLWNVLKGDMSLVGPRPERRYFIDMIMKKAPYYALLHRIKPGLTSLGMVKYGYASNVNQMIERLKYDLLYIENMSLINDFKIMTYTVRTIFSGKGI